MEENKITIKYTGGINSEMDDALRELLERYGWKWSGQGTNLETGVRDIGFYKKAGVDRERWIDKKIEEFEAGVLRGHICGLPFAYPQDIKSFLRQALKDHQKELLKVVVEEMENSIKIEKKIFEEQTEEDADFYETALYHRLARIIYKLEQAIKNP